MTARTSDQILAVANATLEAMNLPRSLVECNEVRLAMLTGLLASWLADAEEKIAYLEAP
jgi:hypothetical protein